MSFMDKVNDFGKKVGQAASDTYKSVSDKSGKLIEEGKIKMKISDKKDEVDELYKVLGKRIYELFETGNDMEEYSDDCQKISSLKHEISELELKAKYLKGLRDCEACNNEIKTSYAFCPHCGAKQEPVSIVLSDEEVAEVEEKEIDVQEEKKDDFICPSCNNDLPKDADFCPFCGDKLEK